ncbi:zinc finger, CCHC-type containing protein, partial [Tanacetum coccineum]
MKSYLDILERLGYVMPNELGVSLILKSLNKDYDQFVQNYNMHSMGKMIAELHAMLKLHEKSIPKKTETPAVLAIWIAPLPKRDNSEKDSVCHHCKEVGHWRRNWPSYQVELKKRKNASVASTLGIFTIKLDAFPNKTWVYDTGYGTHIYNTSQGLKGSKKLKHGALSLYVGNGMCTAIEAIRNFDLVLPSGLIIVLDNFHFVPTITRGVVSISHLVNNGYIHTFTSYGISVSKDNVFYFNAIPRDGYPKETMGYYFYYPLENKIFVARNAEFFENSLMVQEAGGSHGLLESSGSEEGLELIQEEDTQPSENTSEVHNEVTPIEEYELGYHNEPPNYKAVLSDPEFDKWLEAMNMEMQSMKDNQVWVLVDLPPNGRTVRSKWLFKKKTDMDGNVHTFKARLVAKGYTQTYDVDYEETFS